MKKLLKFIAVIFIIAYLISLLADKPMQSNSETPTGAFGIKFGQNIDTLEVIRISSLQNGEKIYQVKSPNPMEILKKYYVLIDEKTKKIYEIWGENDYSPDTNKKCPVDADKILTILEVKYNKPKNVGVNKKSFNINNEVLIYVACDFYNKNLTVRYNNLNFKIEAEKSLKENILEKTDASMF